VGGKEYLGNLIYPKTIKEFRSLGGFGQLAELKSEKR
jgi:hypothetical protein